MPWSGGHVMGKKEARSSPLAVRCPQESVETSYWDDLPMLKMPVLAITGTASGVRMSAEDAERYRSACGAGSLVVIDGADHSLTVNGDRAPFLAVLRGFLTDVDRRRSTP